MKRVPLREGEREREQEEEGGNTVNAHGVNIEKSNRACSRCSSSRRESAQLRLDALVYSICGIGKNPSVRAPPFFSTRLSLVTAAKPPSTIPFSI